MMGDVLKRGPGAAAQHTNHSLPGRMRRSFSGGFSQPGTDHMTRSSSHGSLISATSGEGVKVTFVVPKYVPFGQNLMVVGHGRELGSWEPTQAVKLQWSAGDVWTKAVDLPPGQHEFKCVTVKPDGDLEWQPGSNRVIQVPAEVDAALEAHCDWYGSTRTTLVQCNSGSSAMSDECTEYMDMGEDAASTPEDVASDAAASEELAAATLLGADDAASSPDEAVAAGVAAMAVDVEQQLGSAAAARDMGAEPSVGPPRLLSHARPGVYGALVVAARRASLQDAPDSFSDLASPFSDQSTDEAMDAFVSVSASPAAGAAAEPSGSLLDVTDSGEPSTELLQLAQSVLSSPAAAPQPASAALLPPAGAASAKGSSGLAARQSAGGRSAVAAAAVAAAPARTLPAVAPTRQLTKEGVRTLRLVSGAHMIPHVAKAATGGEDAFFISECGGGGGGAIGVSDGVSAWAEDGIDPGEYSRTLMAYCAEAMEASAPGPNGRAPTKPVDPRAVLKYAQQCTLKHGSATAVLGVLQPGSKLVVANLGDCGVKVVRGRQIALATQPQQHDFNLPYQLSHPRLYPDTDDAGSADRYSFNVQPGDLVVAGSDGLFDNLWDDELLAVVDEAGLGTDARCSRGCSSDDAQRCAAALAKRAFRNAGDKDYKSPWSVAAGKHAGLLARLFAKGGKMDDVTCVVAIVQ